MKNLEKRIWISQTHTIGQWINESIKNHSKKTAIVDGRTHITYTDLGIQVNHYSSYFLQKGIRKGNKVVIQLNNTKEYVFSILALIQIGAIPVLTNYALRDKEVTGIIERSEAIAYVYSKEILGYSYKSMAERIKKRNRELLFIISVAEIEMSSFSDKNIILETPEVTEGIIMYNAFNRSSLRINNGYKYLISGYENIKIVDSEENTVENGQSGEIVIKGPYTINKYFNVDDNTMDKFTYDGFYRTGDKAIFNEYGEYEIIGRIVDQINRAGEKINPQEIEKSVKENSQSVAKVLFHAGTGTLTPYNALLSYIEKDSKENEAIIGFTFGDDADYISMETSQTFRLLGEKYGKILNKLGYSNYILIGHCVGGLIALETAQYLQKKNVQVSDVTLISSNIPKQKNQTILSQATDEIYRKTLQSSLDNEILLERIFAKLIGADAYKAGYQVDEERLQQYIEYIVDQGTGDITVEALCNTGGKFEDVAKEFRLLASKSVSERLNALYNIIERPNGELMEHQLKMLNILFRVFSQNFRCVSTYEPKPYYGNMRILCCEIQGGHFYPGFFAEDYETWKPYAKGNLTFDLIKGWHLDCITEPNLGENIKKMLDFNY